MIAGFLSAGWAGCSKTGSTISTTPVTYLSVMNEALYAGSVTMYLNDTLATAVSGIGPAMFSTKYGTLRPGTYDIKFKKAGSDSLLYEIPYASFDTANFYTVILYNNAGGGPAKAIQLKDDFSTASASNANYRFFNLSPDAPNVDLYLNGAAAQVGRTTADNALNPSYNVFNGLPPGSYNIAVKLAGTDSVLATATNISLVGGYPYTIFLSGLKTPTVSGTALQVNVLAASY